MYTADMSDILKTQERLHILQLGVSVIISSLIQQTRSECAVQESDHKQGRGHPEDAWLLTVTWHLKGLSEE